MGTSKKKTHEKNGGPNVQLPSVWVRTFTPGSSWPQKDEFLDVIYWGRQIIGILLGIIWGIVPLKGFLGIVLFCIINAIVIYVYSNSIQKVDEEEFGGEWELLKEGFMTSFAGFLVTWIMMYSAMHFE